MGPLIIGSNIKMLGTLYVDKIQQATQYWQPVEIIAKKAIKADTADTADTATNAERAYLIKAEQASSNLSFNITRTEPKENPTNDGTLTFYW